MKLRGFFVVMLAIAASACTGNGNPSVVEGVKYLPGPTVTVTVFPATNASSAVPAAPAATKPVAPIHRASAPATYSLGVGCTSLTRRQDGRTATSVRAAQPQPVRAGLRLTYDFQYQRDTTENPVVQVTKRCTVTTQRVHPGAEPRLSVTLGCIGEATYTSNPKPTSAEARS